MTDKTELVERETAAEIIYDCMRLACKGETPAWVPQGNAIFQDAARNAARKVLALRSPPSTLEAKGTADAVRAKLADDLDEQRRLEETTADGEPDNMGETWHSYAQFFIDHHDVITAALRSLPAVTGGAYADGFREAISLCSKAAYDADYLRDAQKAINAIALPAPKAAGDDCVDVSSRPYSFTCPCGLGDEPCPGPDGKPLCVGKVTPRGPKAIRALIPPPSPDARAAVIEECRKMASGAQYVNPCGPEESAWNAACEHIEEGFAALSQSPTTDGAAVREDDLLAACKDAAKWLSGWASAEPYLTRLENAIAKAEAPEVTRPKLGGAAE